VHAAQQYQQPGPPLGAYAQQYGPQPGYLPYAAPPPASNAAAVGLTFVIMVLLLLAIAASYFYVHDGIGGGGSSTPRSPNPVSQAWLATHHGRGA
jgi:hypothetical protein